MSQITVPQNGVPRPSKREEMLLDHSYDGIQEYDNPTPGWWWLIFNASIIFSIAYFAFFTFSPDAKPLLRAEAHQSAMAELLRKQFEKIGTLKADEPTMLKYMTDAEWLQVGRSVFQQRCVACHGPEGAGQVGPNMTDDYYKNVKVLTDIPQVVAEGANKNAMPSWKGQLHPNEIVLVSCYIANLRGKNLPGKEKEGDLIPPWPALKKSESPAQGK